MLRTIALPLLCLAAGEAAACQLLMAKPFAAFDESLFVLIGDVREVIGPVTSNEVESDVYGLRVRITEHLHAPEPVTGLVDVFEYNLSPGCEALGMVREDLERQFPPGTFVRIIARAAARLPAPAADAPHRLEGGPFNAHALIGPLYPEEPLSASFAGVYDFATPIDVARYERIDAERFNWFWYRGLVAFEAIKELLRLENARDDAEKLAILRRVRSIPTDQWIDFAALAEHYLEDPQSAAALGAEPN
jgi:hypothetical protein